MTRRQKLVESLNKSFRGRVGTLLLEEKTAENVHIDDGTKKWAVDHAVVSEAAKKVKVGKSGGDFVGVAETKNKTDVMHLFSLSYDDIDMVNDSGETPGRGEAVLRMATKNSMAGDIVSFVKINYQKGTIAYNKKAEEGELKFGSPEKLEYARFEKSAFNKIKD